MQALILDMIKKHPGITDAELAERLYASPEEVRREAMRIAPPVYRLRTRSPDGWVTSYSSDNPQRDTQLVEKTRQDIKVPSRYCPPQDGHPSPVSRKALWKKYMYHLAQAARHLEKLEKCRA